MSNQIVGFIDQPDVLKKSVRFFVSLHIGRCSIGVIKKKTWFLEFKQIRPFGWNWSKVEVVTVTYPGVSLGTLLLQNRLIILDKQYIVIYKKD